jgi:SAM-dependent methyltransferase
MLNGKWYIRDVTEDTTRIWVRAAQLEDPYPLLLKGRTREEYFREGLVDAERLLRSHIVEIQRKFPKIATLEIGPGLHRFQIPLIEGEKRILRPGDTPIVVDIVPKFLEAAPPRVRPEIDIRDIPNGCIDFAFSFCLFQHLPAEVRYFYAQELKRVTRRGGRIFIQFPSAFSSYYKEKPTLHRFTPEEIRNMFNRGWRIKIEPGNLCRYILLKDPSEWGKEKRELFLIAERR